jgi:hypothetical protein
MLLESQCRLVYDSTYLFHHDVSPPAGASIVLWDGFNSYMELLRNRPDLNERDDVKFACVGFFAEIASALPLRTLKLFPDFEKLSDHALGAPLRFEGALKLKTTLRGFKNLVSDRDRHRQLSRGGNLVFCGLVRPTKQVVANILTNAKLLALKDSFEQLGELHWQDTPEKIHRLVRSIYRQCQQLECSGAEDYSGIYSVLNVCSRLFVINALHARGSKVFINEYSFQNNFDPYDAYAYGKNIYLDFGSSRGACHWYPRTMDMRATGKRFVALRIIQEQQSLRDYLDTHSESDFMEQMDSHVMVVLTEVMASSASTYA